jgi:hypothetical protein
MRDGKGDKVNYNVIRRVVFIASIVVIHLSLYCRVYCTDIEISVFCNSWQLGLELLPNESLSRSYLGIGIQKKCYVWASEPTKRGCTFEKKTLNKCKQYWAEEGDDTNLISRAQCLILERFILSSVSLAQREREKKSTSVIRQNCSSQENILCVVERHKLSSFQYYRFLVHVQEIYNNLIDSPACE